MDRDFIARNQIVERYLSGRLPLKGATDFERFCKDNPKVLDELGLPERVNAGLRLLEASGKPEPWQDKPQRPWAKPHFGSVCERLFKTTNDQFIYTLLGNTQAAERARLLTRAVDPKHHALWMLPDLYSYLCEYTYQVYDQNEHIGIGMTPQAAYLWGLKQGGEREHRRIPYDDRFLKATCPTTPKGTAVVQKGSGVKVNHFYYWNNAFRNPEVISVRLGVNRTYTHRRKCD